MEKKIELFVPGRLCLFGEHSDWAGKYRTINQKIEIGNAIVTGVEQGIYANVYANDKFVVKNGNDIFECEMDVERLKEIASEGSYYSYMAGVAAYIKEHYNVGGIEIEIIKTTLPIKKGLSSSAAICVLVARAFNQLYKLQLNTLGEMNIAYYGEILTPSRCGRLDQACAFGIKPMLMRFDGDNLSVHHLKVGGDFYWVFADLMSKKDTIKILSSLNKCYPFSQNELEEKVHAGLGTMNKEIIEKAAEYLKFGDAAELGKLMTYSQKVFDEMIAPACMEELEAPILHKVLNDERVKELTYGAKGVGSQGDGTVQFLAKDEESQLQLIEYLESLGMSAYKLTIKVTKTVKKAIIPVAGFGTRMYPITKLLKKPFLPVVDKDGFVKPALMVLLEELDNAGIEEICLVIDESDEEIYDAFFKANLSSEHQAKLSTEMLEYEGKIHRIGKKIQYVFQREKLGLGHAVYLCKEFTNNEPTLLLLGDQIYKTSYCKSCTEQLLEFYEKTPILTVSAVKTPLNSVHKYGIMSGTFDTDENAFQVSTMYEKPTADYAEQYLYTKKKGKKLYYSVFGEYVLTPLVFEKLENMIKDGRKSRGEYQLTDALESVLEKEGMNAFIPKGEMFDIGTPDAYKHALSDFYK
jgi:UTP-glucose-1-phosphate uridylyltransferase